MGMSILDLVLQQLQNENITADVAYPGQKYPRITKPMAVVHVQKFDRPKLLVTVEVNIISPAALGGAACEEEALRATEVLRRAGAQCIQNGCAYDGISQVYIVPILATYMCITDVDACVIGVGFQIYINDVIQPFANRFCGTEEQGYKAEYAMGESAAAGISRDGYLWQIELEDMIPTGSSLGPDTTKPFELKVYTIDKVETYSGCCWTSVMREYTAEGIRQIRKGFALQRKDW